jgi:hypothetical protein
MSPALRARLARITRAQIAVANGKAMDTLHAWPGRSSLRIYADYSGAYVVSDAYTGPLSRTQAAELLLALRRARLTSPRERN